MLWCSARVPGRHRCGKDAIHAEVFLPPRVPVLVCALDRLPWRVPFDPGVLLPINRGGAVVALVLAWRTSLVLTGQLRLISNRITREPVGCPRRHPSASGSRQPCVERTEGIERLLGKRPSEFHETARVWAPHAAVSTRITCRTRSGSAPR